MSLIPLAATLTSALFAAVWQGLLLAALVSLSLRVVPNLTAAARSLVWLTVAALAVLLHFTQTSAPATLLPSSSSPGLRLDPRWSVLIVAVWAAASLTRAVQLAVGALELRRLARAATCIVPPDALSANLLAQSHRLESRPARLCTSPLIDRPSVLGFFRPRILLPAELIKSLAPAELHQVLLHELEHLRRRDDWTNLLGRLALVAFPLNPVLFWLERHLATERELACDDRVLAASGGRKAYATCLAHLAEHTLLRRGLSLALNLLGLHPGRPRRSELARRVTRILTPSPTLNPRTCSALVTLLIALATGGSLELTHSPELIHFVAPHSEVSAVTPTSARSQFLSVAYHPRTSVSPSVVATATPVVQTRIFERSAPPKRNSPTQISTPNPAHETRSSRPKRSAAETSSSFLLSASENPELPAASSARVQLVLTVATPNHFAYVTVPVPGGWMLIVLPAQPAHSTLTLEL